MNVVHEFVLEWICRNPDCEYWESKFPVDVTIDRDPERPLCPKCGWWLVSRPHYTPAKPVSTVSF